VRSIHLDDYKCKDRKCVKIQSCDKGFSLHNGTCSDIDECSHKSLNNCHVNSNQECVNTVGSYSCNCLPGFNLDATLNKCVGKYVFSVK